MKNVMKPILMSVTYKPVTNGLVHESATLDNSSSSDNELLPLYENAEMNMTAVLEKTEMKKKRKRKANSTPTKIPTSSLIPSKRLVNSGVPGEAEVMSLILGSKS